MTKYNKSDYVPAKELAGFGKTEQSRLVAWLNLKRTELHNARSNLNNLWADINKAIHPDFYKDPYDPWASPKIQGEATDYRSAIATEVLDCIANLNRYTADPAVRWAKFSPKTHKPAMQNLEKNENYARWEREMLVPAFYSFVNNPETQILESCYRRSDNAFRYGIACRYAAHILVEGRTPGESDVSTLTFETPEMPDVLYEKDARGELTFVCRRLTLTHEQAARRWGTEAIKQAHGLSGKTEKDDKSWLENAPAQSAEYTHYCVARNDLCPRGLGTKYVGFVVLRDSQLVIMHDQLNRSPYAISEFLPGPSGIQGYSVLIPVRTAIVFHDQIMNLLKKHMLFRTSVTTLTAGKLVDSAGIVPGTNIQGGIDHEGRRMVEVLQMPADNVDIYKLLLLKLSEIKERLLFGTLTHPDNAPGMTDTEVRRQIEARATRIRPVITSWVQQDMIPMTRHILHWLFDRRGGALDFPYYELGIAPDTIDPVDAFDIEYDGILMQEQRELETMQSKQLIADIVNLENAAASNPAIAMRINVPETIDMWVRNTNLTTSVVRSQAQVQQIQASRAQAAELERQQQLAEQAQANMLQLAMARSKQPQAGE